MIAFFSRIWAGWKELAGYFGDFQSRWFLTVFYFTIVLPFGLLTRLGMDLLSIRRPPRGTAWISRKDSMEVGVEEAKKPY